MKSILSLPVPVLLKIFSNLDTREKQHVSRVCVYLAKILRDPILWTRTAINKSKLTSEDNLKTFFSISRYSLLVTLDLADLKYQFIDKTLISQFLKYLQAKMNEILNFSA